MTFAPSQASGAHRALQMGVLHRSSPSAGDTIQSNNSQIANPSPARQMELPVQEPMERAICRQVRAVLAGMYPLNVPSARRREERFPFPRLLRLIPASASGDPIGPEVTVVGKQLSEHGLGFFHPGPLPHRWVIVELEVANGTRYAFVLQLLWCRFLREGWYESGGRFSKLVTAPEVTP
ncbi:MAG: hypothetical protein MPJ50_12430 [Pirellulales bacterium]|nr:hypothetical protein [Pirellulales bacterium]